MTKFNYVFTVYERIYSELHLFRIESLKVAKQTLIFASIGKDILNGCKFDRIINSKNIY